MIKQAGKGDKPRNCWSKEYRTNYNKINWKDKSIVIPKGWYDTNRKCKKCKSSIIGDGHREECLCKSKQTT